MSVEEVSGKKEPGASKKGHKMPLVDADVMEDGDDMFEKALGGCVNKKLVGAPNKMKTAVGVAMKVRARAGAASVRKSMEKVAPKAVSKKALVVKATGGPKSPAPTAAPARKSAVKIAPAQKKATGKTGKKVAPAAKKKGAPAAADRKQ